MNILVANLDASALVNMQIALFYPWIQGICSFDYKIFMPPTNLEVKSFLPILFLAYARFFEPFFGLDNPSLFF